MRDVVHYEDTPLLEAPTVTKYPCLDSIHILWYGDSERAIITGENLYLTNLPKMIYFDPRQISRVVGYAICVCVCV